MLTKLKEGVEILEKSILRNRIVYAFPAVLLLTSFGYREPDYCKIADQVVNKYEKEFAKPRGLKLYGYGGAMMEDIQKFNLCFSSFDAADVDKARKLYIEMMEEFICRINCYKTIHPFLHNFPFSKDNVKLNISFIDGKGRNIGNGYVALMGIGKNDTIYYAAYNHDKKEFYDLYRENYSDALKIVNDINIVQGGVDASIARKTENYFD